MENKKDIKMLFCKKCGIFTPHIKCGFGTPGGLAGNGRYKCKHCGGERT